MPGRAIWECMAVLFDVAEDWGLWFHHDFFILYIHKIQSAISSDEKTVHSVEHKPHNSLTISSFMAFPICSYHSEHQIPWIPMDPHGSCLEIFMSSFMSW